MDAVAEPILDPFNAALARHEIAVVQSLSLYSADMFALGYRQQSVEAVAGALAILNRMEEQGRCDDATLPLMKVEAWLREIGTYEDIVARAREITVAG